jgi:NYN domain/OST-HTH/LOTUS domain
VATEPIEQVAVFIDFENLVIGAERAMPDVGRRAVPYAALDQLCGERGNAAVRRAYADWARPTFGKYQEDLALNGVDLIQVTRFGAVQKNAADIRMAVDAMETLITHPEITVYILVAGDGDYSPLVQRLREFGKVVIGVGTEASASRRLVSVCTEYKFWGTLVAEVDPSLRPVVAAEFDIADAAALLLTALDSMADTADADGWCFAGTLKTRIRQLDASFDNNNYGAKTFSQFLSLPPVARSVEVRHDELRLDVRRLTGTAHGRDASPLSPREELPTEQLVALAPSPLPPGAKGERRTLIEAVELMLHVLDGIADEEGWAFAGELKNRMLTLDPLFNNNEYGAKTFGGFLALPAVARRAEIRRRDLIVDVRRRSSSGST